MAKQDTTESQQAAGRLCVGDKVTYYCASQMTLREGTVTAVDVPVEHLWHWPEHGTVMQSPHRPNKPGEEHPLGVQINGSLVRPYYGSGTGQSGTYDKSRVAA
jgi:hypothetical protein